MLGAATLGKGQLPPWNLDDDRDKVLSAIELEVIDLHGNEKFCDRIFEHERIFKLALLVHGGKTAELLVSVITFAITQLGIEILRERNFDTAEVAVLGGVRGVVADEVVIGYSVLSL